MSEHRTSDPVVPLLERERELGVLDRDFDRLAEGRGSLVLVTGPAGIGKTRLIAEVIDRAHGRKLLVRHVRCGELEREMPFGVARQLFEPVVERSSEEDRARLLAGSAALALMALRRPVSGGPASGGDPFAPIHGLYWLLANLVDCGPVVLAVDDAQWADVQTLRFLDYLARRLDDLPALVVVGARTGEPDEPAELERLRLQGELLRLHPLSGPALRALIAAGLGADPSAEFCEACFRATAGNPFLLSEVLRSLRTDALAAGRQAAATVSDLGPESVGRYVLARLRRFGDEAIELARAIAVLGGSPQLRHAARLAGLDEQQAGHLCDRLRDAEILTAGLPLDFVHPLVRQAIYRDLSDGMRSAMHRRAAEVLSTTGVAPGEIAPHLISCLPNGDQWVVAQLADAAWDAIGSAAYDSGQSCLERALEEPPDDELPVLYALGRCMLQTDPTAAAKILTDFAERTTDPALRARAYRHAAEGHVVAGEWRHAVRSYEKLLVVLPEGEGEKRLIAEAERYLIKLGSGRDDTTSRRLQSVAAGLAGVTPGECVARQALALDRFMACAPVDEVVALAASFPSDEWLIRTNASTTGCRILAWSGRWNEARRALGRALTAARQRGLVVHHSYYSSILAEAERAAGLLTAAEAEARTALDIAGAVSAVLNPDRQAVLGLLVTLIARGQLEEAERMTAGIEFSAGVGEMTVSPLPLEVRGYLRLARGDLELGVRDLLAVGEELEGFGLRNPAFSPWRQEAAPALAKLDRSEEAEQLIAVAEERARAFGAQHVIGTVLRSKALCAPREQRVEILGESVTALQAYGPAHELARSLLELGAALRRMGRRREAREPLRRALDLAHRCGADGLESRAREELGAAGARPRRAAITGRDALTATEQRIAAMAATGMSNPEIAQALFVTRKTIENHLARIYPKLGIHSRTQLSAALADTASRPDDA